MRRGKSLLDSSGEKYKIITPFGNHTGTRTDILTEFYENLDDILTDILSNIEMEIDVKSEEPTIKRRVKFNDTQKNKFKKDMEHLTKLITGEE